jgi:hypothetical protein
LHFCFLKVLFIFLIYRQYCNSLFIDISKLIFFGCLLVGTTLLKKLRNKDDKVAYLGMLLKSLTELTKVAVGKGKSKAISLQAWTGPEGSRR